jgi:hypothetical protein
MRAKKGMILIKKIYYAKLRELMAKYLLDKNDIAVIIGKSYRQTSKILHREISSAGNPFVFDINEGYKLVMHFRNLGECKLTFDELFFNDMLSNENKKSA